MTDSAVSPPGAVQCSLCAQRITLVADTGETAWRGLSRRYLGLWSEPAKLAICLSCDRGNRRCPKTGAALTMLRESHAALAQPPEAEQLQMPDVSPEVQDLLELIWTCDDASGVAAVVDNADGALLQQAADELDVSQLPTNPDTVRGFSHRGRDERISRMIEAGLHLLEARPDVPETDAWWDSLLDACRQRLDRSRDGKAPLDDTRDPHYLVASVRQLLVRAGNHLLRARRPREAGICFRTVIAANPELSEVQYAHAVAANNVVAAPGSTRLDRLRALNAFDAFLRSAAAHEDAHRYATVNFLRRQILGMKAPPRP